MEGFKSSRTYSSYMLFSFLEGCSRKKSTTTNKTPKNPGCKRSLLWYTWFWYHLKVAYSCFSCNLALSVIVLYSIFFKVFLFIFFSQLLDYRKAPKLSGQKLLWKKWDLLTTARLPPGLVFSPLSLPPEFNLKWVPGCDPLKHGVNLQIDQEIKRWWWCCYLCLQEETLAFIPAGLIIVTGKYPFRSNIFPQWHSN